MILNKTPDHTIPRLVAAGAAATNTPWKSKSGNSMVILCFVHTLFHRKTIALSATHFYWCVSVSSAMFSRHRIYTTVTIFVSRIKQHKIFSTAETDDERFPQINILMWCWLHIIVRRTWMPTPNFIKYPLIVAETFQWKPQRSILWRWEKKKPEEHSSHNYSSWNF